MAAGLKTIYLNPASKATNGGVICGSTSRLYPPALPPRDRRFASVRVACLPAVDRGQARKAALHGIIDHLTTPNITSPPAVQKPITSFRQGQTMLIFGMDTLCVAYLALHASVGGVVGAILGGGFQRSKRSQRLPSTRVCMIFCIAVSLVILNIIETTSSIPSQTIRTG